MFPLSNSLKKKMIIIIKEEKKKEKFRAQQKLGAAWKQLFAYFTDDIPYVSDGNKQNRGEGEE